MQIFDEGFKIIITFSYTTTIIILTKAFADRRMQKYQILAENLLNYERSENESESLNFTIINYYRNLQSNFDISALTHYGHS